MNKKEQKKGIKWNTATYVAFFAALVAYSVLMYVLFYRQAYHPKQGQWYESDIDAY